MSYDPNDPSFHLAAGDDLAPDRFPELGTLSAIHMYKFVPVPRVQGEAPPEFVYVKEPNGKKQRLAFQVAVTEWNWLWESGDARRHVFLSEDRGREFPRNLRWLLSQERPGVDVRLLVDGLRFDAYAPLYHLLPLRLLERFGLPALKRGLWPSKGLRWDRHVSVLPPDYRERLEKAVAHLLWPLMSDRTRQESFSRSYSPILLAHNLDFWLPYLDLVIQSRVRRGGRWHYDKEERTEQRRDLRALRRQLRDVDAPFTAERPLRGFSPWIGEEDAREAAVELVATADRAGRLGGILDAFRSSHLEDDFSARWSWEREDFERKLYRKRDRIRVTFVELKDTVPVVSPDTELDERLLWSDLFALLDPKERSIAVCLRSGLTQTDIASRLGYANHSAISKALARIRAKARNYLDN
jgi:hypothetical protein